MKKITAVTTTVLLFAMAWGTTAYASGHVTQAPDRAGTVQIGGEFGFTLDYFTGYPLGFVQDATSGGETAAPEGGAGTATGSPTESTEPPGSVALPGHQLQESWRPGVRQDLRLYLAARTSARSDVFVSLASQGVWGVQFPSDGSYGMDPTFGPLLIDEANFRYASENFTLTAGRLYATMGPVGLICSSPVYPFEGALGRVSIGDSLEISALYSRLSSQYRPHTSMVIGGDDLLAFRLAKKAGQWVLGYNYLYTGLVDEQAQSVDFRGAIGRLGVRGELAFARPPSTFDPDFNRGWVPGWVITGDLLNTASERLSVTVGSLANGFEPTFSSSATAGGQDLYFYENTRGVQAGYTRNLREDTTLSIDAAILAFNDPEDAHEKGLDIKTPLKRWSVEVARRLSPSSEVNFGYSAYSNYHSAYGRIQLGYKVSF